MLPAFISWHRYLSSGNGLSNREMLDKVPAWVLHRRRATGVGSGFRRALPLAITEWNFTSEADERDETEPEFVREVTDAMLDQFLEHGLWLSVQFAFSSDPVDAPWTWSRAIANRSLCSRPLDSTARQR